MSMKDLNILYDKINYDPITSCWNWTKSASQGYGNITVDGVAWQVHRYAASAIYGKIPDGMVVRHSYHNTLCCNPNHLSIGTHKDNWEDSKSKHRVTQLSLQRKGGWTVNGKVYSSLRAVSKETGLGMKTLMGNMIDGIFDIETYRSNCKKQNLIPKV